MTHPKETNLWCTFYYATCRGPIWILNPGWLIVIHRSSLSVLFTEFPNSVGLKPHLPYQTRPFKHRHLQHKIWFSWNAMIKEGFTIASYDFYAVKLIFLGIELIKWIYFAREFILEYDNIHPLLLRCRFLIQKIQPIGPTNNFETLFQNLPTPRKLIWKFFAHSNPECKFYVFQKPFLLKEWC